MTRAVCAIFVSLMFVSWPLLCQIGLDKTYRAAPLGSDTLCYRYTFVAGDSLAYIIDSKDSIDMVGQPTLIKSRSELVLVFCDSVTPNGHYRLRIRLQTAREKQANVHDTIDRSGSPWIDREAIVTIDSLGNRIMTAPDDTRRFALSPGGAFQPLLFPALGQSCGRQNESWIFESTDALVENGVPTPAYKQQTLWRVLDRADTLNRGFLQIQYTQTGVGAVNVMSSDVKLNLNAKIAAYGKLSMDSLLHVPFHLFATSENRLTITAPNGMENTGKHMVSTHMQLVEIRSPKPERRFRIRQGP